MANAFDEAVLAHRPLLYWKGGVSGDASSVDVRDLSKNGYHATIRTPAQAPIGITASGDDSSRTGWRQASNGNLRNTGSIPGFVGTAGTVLILTHLSTSVPNYTTNNQALFDTGAGQVGAIRLYTNDGWSTMRFERGGDSVQSVSTSTFLRRNRIQMFAVVWQAASPTLALWVDGEFIQGYARGGNATGASFNWGMVNNSSEGKADHHSIMVFDKVLSGIDQKKIYRTLMENTKEPLQRHRLRR